MSKKDSYAGNDISSSPSTRPNVDLTTLIYRMQKDADYVERNLILAEEKLVLDAEHVKNGLSTQYQKDCNGWLDDTDNLFMGLFQDMEQAKKLGHPQCQEIELDIGSLRERWESDYAIYRDIYEKKGKSEVDWPAMLHQKLRQVTMGEYGPGVPDAEKQIASHNILHKEIEAYRPLVESSASSSPGASSALRTQYKDLLESSQQRSRHLASLYDYLLACTRETAYLRNQQEKVLKQDWSDRNLSLLDVCQLDENFKAKSLQSHESEADKLQNEGTQLIQTGHPASQSIKNHRDNLQSERQKFLSLYDCRENHLDNMKEYKKFQSDAETLSDSLRKLSTNLDLAAQKYRSSMEVQRPLEGDDRLLMQSEELLAELRKRSVSVFPLRSRRRPPVKGPTAVSLCDWKDSNCSVAKGERFTLQSNYDPERWSVQASNGATKSVPAACLVVPPPDPEASDRVDRLERDLADLKKKRANLQSGPKSTRVEVVRTQYPVVASSPTDDPKVRALSSQLDRISDDLEQARRDTLGRLRAPLDHKDPVRDLSNRLKEQEHTDSVLKNLGEETATVQRGVEALSSVKPSDAVISALRLKLNTTKNKHDDVTSLADLCTKKANASVYLENQMEKVDVFVSGFEDQLAEELPLLDKPGALRERREGLQHIRKNVAVRESDMQQLGRDLEAVQQMCSSLQAGYQEYCPDLGRQNTEVQSIRKRYSNLQNQLKSRETAVQDIASKNQAFQSAAQSLTSFLNKLPNNKLYPSDGLTQVDNKMSSQSLVVEEVSRRKDDLDRMTSLSQDLQSALSDYDTNCNKYHCIVDDSGTSAAQKVHINTLAKSVQNQEKHLLNHFSEASAENEQLLKQMKIAKKLIVQNGEKASEVVVQQRVFLQSQQKSTDELESLKQDLVMEVARRARAEDELETYQKRMISLKNRRGVERLEEKEVIHYYRDANLESQLQIMLSRIHDEELKSSGTKAEIELVNRKIVLLQNELKNVTAKLVTKVVTEYERDPKLEIEATKIREELQKLREAIRTRESDFVSMKTEITILEQKKPVFKERVVKKEIVKLERNPELVQAVSIFQMEIANEHDRCQHLNDEIFQIRGQINLLERMIPTIEPKVIIKEVKRVERDLELVSEAQRLSTSLEEERVMNRSLMEEITKYQVRYVQVEKVQQRIEVKETTKEIFRVDPETEQHLVRLKIDLKNLSMQRMNLEQEMNLVVKNLESLRSQKPKVEVKEVTRQVVKEEASPEVVKEIQRLNNQLSILQSTYSRNFEQLMIHSKERDEWKATNSKVETKIISRETVRYENDPLIEKEAERLRKEVREETQRRRTFEEMVFNLQNTYLELERQKPEERVVVQETIRLQRDPKQIIEHEKLSRILDEEIKSRRKLELEVQQLRSLVKERELVITQVDERQKKIQVEMELRQIRSRIKELESKPPSVTEKIIIEEVVQVERDATLDRVMNDLRVRIDRERNLINSQEKDIQNLSIQLEILHREKSVERVIYKEVIRVEKDETLENERAQLRERVSYERNARKNMEEEIERLSAKLKYLQSLRETKSTDMDSLTKSRSLLLREKENLLLEFRQLDSRRQESTISFQQQSQLLSEQNQVNKQKSIMLESEVRKLEKDILDEKDKIYKQELYIKELQGKSREEKTSERKTNVSTRITILDPETGKDMSPSEAYLQGLIDKNYYLHLQQMECDWEEISSSGPEGERLMMLDRKSGKKYSVEDALREGRLTQYDLQQYRQGKMHISEFALLVAGGTKVKPTILLEPKTPVTPQKSSISFSSRPTNIIFEDKLPISGLYDTTTKMRMSVRTGITRNIIDSDLGLKLLEAQAATGGIIDVTNGTRYSVHKATVLGLIERTMMQHLMNAQKAFTGTEDSLSNSRLSVGQAMQKGLVPKGIALRFMEAQVLTGGLVDPNQAGRFPITEALRSNLIDNSVAEVLKDDSTYPKYLEDPITKEVISYKEAMARCKKDPHTELMLFPVASKEINGAGQTFSSRSSSSFSSRSTSYIDF
ncbi:envoplakin-like [Paramormyrops kingsleyae]